jgi:hypothetical protein
MRRNLCIVLVMLSILALNNFSFALEEKVVDGMIIHESGSLKFTDNFVDDVLSLLPPDMLQALEPHQATLSREARFNVRDDYWRRGVVGMDDFKSSLGSISIKNSNELASQLGRSVEHIFEIAMRPKGDDMMNEGLKRNLKNVLSKWRNEKYVVNYDGYKGQSVDAILASLYEMKKTSKINLYPDLVTTTADLWSAIWQRGGGKTQLVTKTFVRKPTEFRKGTVPSIRK